MPMDQQPAQILGWRLWRLGPSALYSPMRNFYVWRPGENKASCAAPPDGRCSSPPGQSCHCGFWAVWSPQDLPTLAGIQSNDPLVLGLINGFGTVAVHGQEGFRAEMASIACLFTDKVQSLQAKPRIPWRLRLHFGGGVFGSPDRRNRVQTVADTYGVPCASLEAAESIGLLSELGVRPDSIAAAKTWLNKLRCYAPPPRPPKRPPAPKPPPPSGPLRLRPA